MSLVIRRLLLFVVGVASFGSWCLAQAPPAAAPKEANAKEAAAPPAAKPSIAPLTAALGSQYFDPSDEAAFVELNHAILQFRLIGPPAARKELAELVKKYKQLPPVQILMVQLFAASNQPGLVREELDSYFKEVGRSEADPEAYLMLTKLAIAERRWVEAELLVEQTKGILPLFAGHDRRKKNVTIAHLQNQAAVAEHAGNWDDAINFFSEWVKMDGTAAEPHTRLGNAYFQKKDYTKAQTEFKKARDLDPKRQTPELAMAIEFEGAKNHDEGKKRVAAAVAADKKNVDVLLQAVGWGLSCNEPLLAKEYAAAAQKLEPESARTNFFCGFAMHQLKDYAGAEKFCEKAVVLEPNDFMYANIYALVLAEQNKKEKINQALKYAGANADKNSKNPTALATFAWVLFKADRKQDALRAAEMALSAAGGGGLAADAFYNLAVIYDDIATLAKNDELKDRAAMLVFQALNNSPNFPYKPEAQKLKERLVQEGKARQEAAKALKGEEPAAPNK